MLNKVIVYLCIIHKKENKAQLIFQYMSLFNDWLAN